MGKVEGTIIELLFKQHRSLTIRQISGKLGKAYPHIHTVTTRLLDEGVLTKDIVGNAYACSLNLQHEKAKAMVILEEYGHASLELKKKRVPAQVLADVEKMRHVPGVAGVLWDHTSLVVLFAAMPSPSASSSFASLSSSSSSPSSSSPFSSSSSSSFSASSAKQPSAIPPSVKTHVILATSSAVKEALAQDHVIFFGTMGFLDAALREEKP